ncbi:MAG: hypothetical protein WBD55_10920 [Dehalococcoidia bacterium]
MRGKRGKHCSAKTKDGKRCGAFAVTASAMCFQHDSRLAQERATARSRGGIASVSRRRAKTLPGFDLETRADALKMLRSTIQLAVAGQLAPQRAAAVKTLVESFLATLPQGEAEALDVHFVFDVCPRCSCPACQRYHDRQKAHVMVLDRSYVAAVREIAARHGGDGDDLLRHLRQQRKEQAELDQLRSDVERLRALVERCETKHGGLIAEEQRREGEMTITTPRSDGVIDAEYTRADTAQAEQDDGKRAASDDSSRRRLRRAGPQTETVRISEGVTVTKLRGQPVRLPGHQSTPSRLDGLPARRVGDGG